MAKMIPSAISIFKKNSLEDIIFESFENLSEDYYVFHSMQILHKEYNGTYDTEIDFIIFHPQKGVLIIEAKAKKSAMKGIKGEAPSIRIQTTATPRIWDLIEVDN